MTKPKFIIIGNAPVSKDRSTEIDSSDVVVRFNRVQTFYSGKLGVKTTYLAVRSNGGPAIQAIAERHNRIVEIPKEILSEKPIPLLYGSGNLIKTYKDNYPELSISRLTCHGDGYAQMASERLNNLNHRGFKEKNWKRPTLGFIFLVHIIEHLHLYNEYELIGIGWKWTNGWDQHPWNGEKILCKEYQQQGLIEFRTL